ncbi:MAG: hypothetical protein IJJ33_18545 [Victivallales bacterium]|nr:hypothetical protein [Victivallales bacterium]
MATIPRPEYPRPQFARKEWQNLNGEWEFEIDYADTGLERGLRDRSLSGVITVPFCPESHLSGVEHTDFMNAVWYRREVAVPREWRGQRLLLHFQAVDYETTVWVNGREVGRHRGGFTPFSCDLGPVSQLGAKMTVVVRARDSQTWLKPGGKQSDQYGNYGCFYTRTTGIWQTVWMEPVPETRLLRPRITPSVADSCFRVELPIANPKSDWRVTAVLRDSGGEVATATAVTGTDFAPVLTLRIPEDRLRLWQPGDGQLYDLELTLADKRGNVVDHATSYAGLRSVAIDGYKILVNGKPVFQRLVLDQGYYPDGLMTAPTDEALVRDITLSMRAGFNGARLHQKVFEERFLYHADSLGYLVWGEFGDWGGCVRYAATAGQAQPDAFFHQPAAAIIAQWTEVLARDYSHPSIVGWCPLNETWEEIGDRITTLSDLQTAVYLAAKNMDVTRPVLDTSGYSHRIAGADVFDSHNYTQDPGKFANEMAGLANDQPFVNVNASGGSISVPYAGQPYFCSEFGGICWNPRSPEGWGYGEAPQTIEEFYARFKGLCDVLLDNPRMFGYCYTQLTDVFQECNGIFFFDRSQKFDLGRIYAVQTRRAASERV